jgi:hypothetical protein
VDSIGILATRDDAGLIIHKSEDEPDSSFVIKVRERCIRGEKIGTYVGLNGRQIEVPVEQFCACPFKSRGIKGWKTFDGVEKRLRFMKYIYPEAEIVLLN